MEYTKIKPKHFLYTDMSLGNIGCMTVLLCLTAHLERLPTERERVKHTHIKALRSLEEALIEQSRTVDEVLIKVLEDVDKVEHQRKLNARHQKTYREKHVSKEVSHKPLHKPLEKIKEDKIREDKSNKYPFLLNTKFSKTFDDYKEMRKANKSKMTDAAIDLALKKLHSERVDVAIKIMEESISNGWKGLFPLKSTQKKEHILSE